MDAFDDNNAKLYYDELILLKEENLKLKKSLEIFEKKRDAHRKICLDNSNKMKDIIIHCEFCNLDFRKPGWINHTKTDKHKKNLQLKNSENNEDKN